MAKHKLKTIKEKCLDKLPFILSFLAIILYIIQASYYIHHIQPVMDEGSYLLKGKWFIDGTYQPFQDYGPPTTYPPLSFISLGISQFIFGIGLESGRILAILYSVLMLIGLWLTVQRVCGKWWALFSIVLFVISPAWIIYYSRAMTQVVSSLLVIWSLFFILGENDWELAVGMVLAIMTSMIRQNMLPFFGFVALFVIWSKGFVKGWKPIVLGILIFLIFNALFWPNIYKAIWEPYLPATFNNIVYSLFQPEKMGQLNIDYSQLRTGSTNQLALPAMNKDYLIIDEIQVLFDAMRFFFLPFITAMAALVCLFIRGLLSENKYRTIAFLAVTFLGLTAIHYWASATLNMFLYSFPAYIAFYLPLGILLIPVFIQSLPRQQSLAFTIIFTLLVVITMGGMGLSLREEIAQLLMNIRVPSAGSIFHGEYELWDVLMNRFGLSISTQKYLLPIIAGLLVGLILIGTTAIVFALIRKNKKPVSYFSTIFTILLGFGILLSPTGLLAEKGSISICENDVLERNLIIGEKLHSIIPPHALVYWEGNIPTPLLYMPENKLFPVQLNMKFNYLSGGDPDILARYGFWNDQLARQWIEEADYLVLSPEVSESRGIQTRSEYLEKYDLIAETISLNPCNDSTILLIFHKIQS